MLTYMQPQYMRTDVVIFLVQHANYIQQLYYSLDIPCTSTVKVPLLALIV